MLLGRYRVELQKWSCVFLALQLREKNNILLQRNFFQRFERFHDNKKLTQDFYRHLNEFVRVVAVVVILAKIPTTTGKRMFLQIGSSM